MVQRRKRTQFTQKFKEHLEKVEGIIQEAIESLPDTDSEGEWKDLYLFCLLLTIAQGLEDVKDVKGLREGEVKSVEDHEKDTCSNLDRIMCQIVDQLSQDLNWRNFSFRFNIDKDIFGPLSSRKGQELSNVWSTSLKARSLPCEDNPSQK